jgi:hypothetical protein
LNNKELWESLDEEGALTGNQEKVFLKGRPYIHTFAGGFSCTRDDRLLTCGCLVYDFLFQKIDTGFLLFISLQFI